MAEALFREQVIEEGRQRLTGAVIAAVPPSSRLYTRLVALAACLTLAVLVFGSYTTITSVRGMVAYDAGVARVYPREAAEVAAIHVREGQRVSQGQPLVTLAIAQGAGGLREQFAQIGNQDSELNRQLDLASAQSASEIAALGQQAAGQAALIASLERQRALAADQIRLAETAVRRAERLAAEGAGTQRQVEDSRSALLARRSENEALGEQIIAQRNALSATEAERARRQLEVERSQSMLQVERSALAEQRAQLARTDRLVLTAPVAGTVGDVALEIGQQATPGRSLASVIPAGSELEIWLYAPSRAVGNAKPGQHVRLQFDAFPYQKYGSGLGIVTAVARVPTDPGNLDPSLDLREPVFRIRTKILELSPNAQFDVSALRPGMTLNAKLETERRRLWQVLLGPVWEAFR